MGILLLDSQIPVTLIFLLIFWLLLIDRCANSSQYWLIILVSFLYHIGIDKLLSVDHFKQRVVNYLLGEVNGAVRSGLLVPLSTEYLNRSLSVRDCLQCPLSLGLQLALQLFLTENLTIFTICILRSIKYTINLVLS